MSGVVKSVGRTFKRVTKGAVEIVKAVWKPALAVAAAYFVVGLAAGKFGGPEVLQKLPGFGETGLFTKLSSVLGFDFYGDQAASATASAASQGVPGAVQASSMLPHGPQGAPLADQGGGLLQQGAMLTPQGMEALGPGAEVLSANTPATPPGGETPSGGDTTGGLLRQFGPYYLAGQLAGGYGQAKMLEEQMAQGDRQFDRTMEQRDRHFTEGRMHPGAYGGTMADGSGVPLQLTPPQVPQVAPPQVAPVATPQAPSAQPLSLDDLLKLQERGLVR